MSPRFPHFKQLDASDCGPASLRMIARFYGIAYSAEMLRKHCHISRYGVTMRGIDECAQYIGFETMGLSLSFEKLAEEGVFPCILHWNQNHFVVCYGIIKNNGKYHIYIADPASQRLIYTREEFERCWIGCNVGLDSKGAALMLEPSDNFGQIEDEYIKNSRSLLSFAKYFTPYRGMICLLVLAMLLGSLIQLILLYE